MRLLASFAVISLLLVVSPDVLAGQLGEKLTETISTKTPDQFVSVWIRLHDKQDTNRLSKTVATQAATRAERHRIAHAELKQRSLDQNDLLTELESMASRNQARNVKGHWIVNVIEAEIEVGQLEHLAAREDIDVIYQQPKIELVAPDIGKVRTDHSTATATVGSNLTHINAPAAWNAGYTGLGRVVCAFDNGVLGGHPALKNSWKGNDGDTAAAWFDQLYEGSAPHPFPETYSYYYDHGTHTMGTIVGRDDATGDTTGVAIEAEWIGAAVVDIAGVSVLDAFEWAADPDGNPNTIDDVPDVINHSWGLIMSSCLNIVYDAIDNTEALGIVNVFAAGNEGSASTAIRNPADRALDSIDCFAVGNLQHEAVPPTIASNSSRGPSPCNGAIKPNVVAPGTDIRSTWNDSSYNTLSGTSMAAPHVSGLVALLRQKNPDATVDQIKTAILNSTQRAGFGTIPNNTYGWGEIDCMAALNALPGPDGPDVRLYDFSHAPISPGDTVAGTIVLTNPGTMASNVSVSITGSNSDLTILSGNASFGNIAHGAIVRSNDSIRAIVSPGVCEGSQLPIELSITGTGYSDITTLYFVVEPPLKKSIATHDVGRIEFSLSNYGVYGLGPDLVTSIYPTGGVGFTFDGGSNELYEGGIMVGDDFTRVSSGWHNALFTPDMDFKVAPDGNLEFFEPGMTAQQTHCIYNDSNAHDPLGLEIEQESFALAPPNDDYLVMRYILRNVSGATLSNVYFGLFMDFDCYDYRYNAGGYDTASGVTWIAYNSGTTSDPQYAIFRGLKLLQGSVAAAGAIPAAPYYPCEASPSGPGFPTNEKFRILTSGMQYAYDYDSAKTNLFIFITGGPLNISTDGCDTLSYAIMAADNLTGLKAVAERAQSIYTDVDEIPPVDELPSRFVLHQNYPNPFNPSTVISFEMPHYGAYTLTVMNLLGRTVHKESGTARAGTVNIEWNADGLASGVYLYEVRVGECSETRKMILLK